MPSTPTLADVIRQAMQAELAEVHTAMPGKVHRVYADRGTIDIKPQLRTASFTADGERVLEDLPIIPDVPVQWPRAGGFSLKMPINVGDAVTLLFNEQDLGVWREQEEPADSGDLRRHGLSGAVALLGAFTKSTVPAIPAANLELGHEGTDAATIEITPDEIRLTKGATEYMARADRVETQLQDLANALIAAQTPPGTAGGPLTWAPGTNYTGPTPGVTGADNVKGT